MKKPCVKLAFYKARGNWMNFLIRLKTKGIYSHTELVFSDGLSFSSSQWDGGTRFVKIEYETEKWDFIELEVTREEEKKIRQFCEKHNHLPYDWFAIVLAQIFHFYANKPNKWFCSEICTRALQEIKMIVGESANMVAPQHLYELLLQEEKVKHRQWLHMKFLENREMYFENYWKIIYTSFAVILLTFVLSKLVETSSVQAFLGSMFGGF